MVYVLVLITAVYYGDVASPMTKHMSEAQCMVAGNNWITQAREKSVRNPRFICLPQPA